METALRQAENLPQDYLICDLEEQDGYKGNIMVSCADNLQLYSKENTSILSFESLLIPSDERIKKEDGKIKLLMKDKYGMHGTFIV